MSVRRGSAHTSVVGALVPPAPAAGSVAGGPTRVRGAQAALRRAAARRPEAWIYVVATAAGLAVAAGVTGGPGLVPPPGAAGGHHGHGAGGPPLTGGGGVGAAAGAWWWWMAMVAAMMLPVVAPHARRIALRSLWHRRHRSAGAFLLGYLAVWAALGTVVVAALAAAGTQHPPATAPVVALAVAAVWQVSAPRRRVLRRCGTPRPAALRGWPADRDALVTGGRAGLRCTVTCGPAMLAMAVSHSVWLMAGLLVLLLTERARGPNPGRRAGRPHEAWALVAFAGIAALAAVT